jgi:predicted RecB family endonuclease
MKAFVNTTVTKQEMDEANPESAEAIVAKHLRDRGFAVAIKESESSNGIDIVAIKNGKYFTIEVKGCIASTRTLVVGGLSKSGLISTHVAIVTPKKNVIFQTTEDHLKLCRKTDKRRAVTKLVEIYDC